MDNPVVDLFTEITDGELRQGIKEIQEDEQTGIIRIDGVVRKYSHKVQEITHANFSMTLFLTQTSLLREAAYRWIK